MLVGRGVAVGCGGSGVQVGCSDVGVSVGSSARLAVVGSGVLLGGAPTHSYRSAATAFAAVCRPPGQSATSASPNKSSKAKKSSAAVSTFNKLPKHPVCCLFVRLKSFFQVWVKLRFRSL